ncbi:SWIM zinc finger family protein [Amedibacillus sp. YH-ame6]
MRKYWDIPTYSQISVEELREKAEMSSQKAASKGKTMEPVIISGKGISQSWWGQSWCANLERYADYDNRLSRGKRYVRSGAVIDLQIIKGKILARVQGSRKAPYKVEIHISPLKEDTCQNIMAACANKIDSLESLITGDFPDEFKDLFTNETGLFPNPREISFQCSCPDWAVMCKHVAAVLYGIGARLDDNPFLFFTLRGIDVEQLIDTTIANKVEMMLSHSDVKSERILDTAFVHDVFGVI